jgi:hypothetical protein
MDYATPSLRKGGVVVAPHAPSELGSICLQDLACMADNSTRLAIPSTVSLGHKGQIGLHSPVNSVQGKKACMEASAEACFQEQIDKASAFGMADIATALSTIQTQLQPPAISRYTRR